jgi:acetyl-CoA synthetase
MAGAPQLSDAFRQSRDALIAHREDYEGAVAAFSWPRLQQFNWALDWFDVIAHLRSLGLRRGDRILLMLGNVPNLWELMLAAIKLSCPVIPTTTLMMPQRSLEMRRQQEFWEDDFAELQRE